MEQSAGWRKYPEHDREPDSVTGLPSRKDLDEDLPSLLRVMGSANFPMAVLMVDIDHFKKFNDKWGHNTGDRVLRHVSDLIRETIAYRGEAYRYGGEEITILLPNCIPSEGLETAKRLCRNTADSFIEYTPSEVQKEKDPVSTVKLSVTISLGVSCFPRSGGDELLVNADKALYKAKKAGRNQAILYESSKLIAESTVILDVRFPKPSVLEEGRYIILASWFSRGGDPTDIEVLEISDPVNGSRDYATGKIPDGGLITAEVRGRVGKVARMENNTFFSFEVQESQFELMIHHLKNAGNN